MTYLNFLLITYVHDGKITSVGLAMGIYMLSMLSQDYFPFGIGTYVRTYVCTAHTVGP